MLLCPIMVFNLYTQLNATVTLVMGHFSFFVIIIIYIMSIFLRGKKQAQVSLKNSQMKHANDVSSDTAVFKLHVLISNLNIQF